MSHIELEIKEVQGILFIGDPHVTAKKYGRRLDENFCETICGKLDQSFQIAREKKWYPVILGDLLNDENECNAVMLTRLIKTLACAGEKPITLVGNHEKKQFYLTDDTALAVLREAQLIDTLERSGPRVLLKMGDKRVLLGGTPYGQEFPSSVEEIRKEFNADYVIWLSHHDLAFQGAYPGALIIPEIKGVDVLVNGHMHKTTPPVKVGNMMAFNPGNITRMSVDTRDHIPSVWGWEPGYTELERFELTHRKDVMNLSGYVFEEAAKESKEEAKAHLILKESLFTQLLKQQSHENADQLKTDDAQFLKEEIDALHTSMASDDHFKAYIVDLLKEAMSDDD